MRHIGGASVYCVMLASLLVTGPAVAQTRPPASSAESPEAFRAEVVRARALGRLGRTDEALALFRDLLARRPADPLLREYYVEALIEAGLMDRALETVNGYLRDDPRSPGLRRLRARIDLDRGEPEQAAERLAELRREQPEDTSLTADLALAERRSGRWGRALALYDEILARDPGNAQAREARTELRWAYAPRIELSHRSFFQESASGHTEEIAWGGPLADGWWLRAAARLGLYDQDREPGRRGFTEDVETVAALLAWQPRRRWTVQGGLDESRTADAFVTTLRAGGIFDDERGTRVSLGGAYHELLTNPVAAVPRRGTTDRLTLDLWQRIVERVAAAGRVEYRHYRVQGQELGDEWEVVLRAEVDVVRRPVGLVLVPLVFFSDYTPAASAPLREEIAFLPRQEIIGLGAVLFGQPLPGLVLRGGLTPRYDVHRDVSAVEVSADARWRARDRVQVDLGYIHSTESLRVGGREDTFTVRLIMLY
jgi:hypothetical protein